MDQQMRQALSDAVKDAAVLVRRLDRECDNLRTKLRSSEGQLASATRQLKVAEAAWDHAGKPPAKV